MASKRKETTTAPKPSSKKAKSEAQSQATGHFKQSKPASGKFSKAGTKAGLNNAKSAQQGPTLILNDNKWDGIVKEARRAMGGKVAIHGDVNNVNRIDDVLRVFDLTYRFGPATGMTRLERWNRAEELGLDPPVEVKDILLTREGLGDSRYLDSYATQAGV